MKLADWLETVPITRTEFARRCGVTGPHITGLCKGESLPSLQVAQAIERETGGAVGLPDWGTGAAEQSQDAA